YDAICGEFDRGTLLLLLSYPVSRWHLVLGKFAGHLAILAFATVIGYGSAAIALVATGDDIAGWQSFTAMIGTSILPGAAVLAIGVWLLFVLIYDMALLGLLVVDKGRIITAPVLNGLLLLNPADAYRVLNLSGLGGVSQFTGMAGVSQDAALPVGGLIAA